MRKGKNELELENERGSKPEDGGVHSFRSVGLEQMRMWTTHSEKCSRKGQLRTNKATEQLPDVKGQRQGKEPVVIMLFGSQGGHSHLSI